MPRLSAHDVAHALLSDSETASDSRLWNRTGQLANSRDVGRCEFGGVMRDASRHSGAVSSVAAILFLVTNIQVVWVSAASVVATMQHVQAVRDCPDVSLVREPMHVDKSSIYPKLSVSVRVDGAEPIPTGVGFGKPGQETFNRLHELIVTEARRP